ncbi:MAG: ammonium transporter [Solirubrobacteraceae bacterium]|nr:ammonium transporter [Solirubrobacteraceae bacterium]
MAYAQDEEPVTLESLSEGLGATASSLDATWIMVSAALVILMQVGFMFLEIGFSRGKNVGTVVAKILVNFSVAAMVWWAVGYAIAFGGGGDFVGDSGFFLNVGQTMSAESTAVGLGYPAEVEGINFTFFLFQFAFAAVSLAIVWGSTLERIKFAVYPIYAVVFVAIIYPLIAHQVWAGGLESIIGQGVQDFAGSSVVHLTGATGALAALLILGPRRGKFGADGKPRPIPGHNMPLFGLAVLILWVGWFGFNAGSTFGAANAIFGQVAVVTNLGAAGGVIGAAIMVLILGKTLDVGMVGNGAIAGLVAITAPSGYVDPWAGAVIGLVAGFIVVPSIYVIDKKLDDPVGVLSAHGIAGIWGTLACGLFTTEALTLEGQSAGLFYGGGLTQLFAQLAAVVMTFLVVFIISYLTFWIINKTIGMRVTADEELAGLDISEHGMYGYPEQFIPEAELVGFGVNQPLTAQSVVAKSETPA